MKYEFNNGLFKKWFDLNGLSRNRIINELGQRDTNKVGRWILGQTIGTEDLIALCNHFNLEISDFILTNKEKSDKRIDSLLPEEIKERRNAGSGEKLTEIATTSLKVDDLTIARLSLQYEQKLNALNREHLQDMKESRASTRQQIESRNKLINTLQDTIAILNKDIENKQKSEETLQDTIKQLQLTIQQQQNTIASYDAIIRKQKKIPSQPSPFFSGQATMVQDGGGAISATPPQNND